MMGKIGIYGGSFDPVHHGHLLVARAAMEELDLEEIIFVPAARSPFKSNIKPAQDHHRLAMLQLALNDVPGMSLCPWEIDQGGISFTIDTVHHLRALNPQKELYYIIGADQCSGLSKWKNIEELKDIISFAVVPRPGFENASLPQQYSGQFLKGHLFHVSSSLIRDRLSQRLPIQWFVPPSVENFIHINSLYL